MSCRILIIDFFPVINGTASFVMGAYRHLDRSRFQYDFLISEAHKHHTTYLDEIKRLGGRIYYFDYNRDNLYGERIDKLREFLLSHPEIRGVHVHDTRWQTGPLVLADELGLPIKVIHSHTSWGRSMPQSRASNPDIVDRIRSISGPQFARLACSDLAGTYLYHDLPFEMIPNGIETDKFVYDPLYRELARNKLGVSPETYVIGFVSNNSLNKNIPKALEVFEEFQKIVPGSILLMVGLNYSNGDAANQINASPCKGNIRHVEAPNMTDIMYPAMDLVLNTSVNEGLPFAIVEAQATGLPCLISDEITSMVCLTNLVKLFPLEKSSRDWAEEMLRILECRGERASRTEEIKAAGFDIRQVADRLMVIYQGQLDASGRP